MVVLEARERVGGRVEQVSVDGERPVQLGGELVGQRAHGVPRPRRGARADADDDLHGGRGRDDVRPRRGRAPLGGRVPVRERGGARGLRARRAALRGARRNRRPGRPVVASRTRPDWTMPRWRAGCARCRRCRRLCGRSRRGRSRSPRGRASARRFCRSCARPLPWATRASTRTTSGSRSRSRRGAPRSRCAWVRSSANAFGSARSSPPWR